jgi:hypothetical protein
MSHDVSDGDQPLGDSGDGLAPEDYGGLTVEDEPGTVNPADLAGTASEDDDEVGYDPAYSEADGPAEDTD